MVCWNHGNVKEYSCWIKTTQMTFIIWVRMMACCICPTRLRLLLMIIALKMCWVRTVQQLWVVIHASNIPVKQQNHIDILNENIFQVSAFLCYDTEDYEIIAKLNYYPYGLLISCIFLAITLAVYLLLPKVLNNDWVEWSNGIFVVLAINEIYHNFSS